MFDESRCTIIYTLYTLVGNRYRVLVIPALTFEAMVFFLSQLLYVYNMMCFSAYIGTYNDHIFVCFDKNSPIYNA